MADSQNTRIAPEAPQSPSRRNILTAGAAAIGATAVAAPVALGAVAEDDPILAAIERHRAALARFNNPSRLTDEVVARTEGRVITDDDRAVWARRRRKRRR